MDHKKILTGLLSRAYKMEEGRISEILEKADESEVLLDLLNEDRDRVSKLTPKAGEDGPSKFKEGYSKAKKEERAAFEKELKEQYGIESDLQGKELIEHIVQAKTAEATKDKKGTMTEDEIKVSPVYRSLEKSLAKQLADKETEWKTKLEDAEKTFAKKEVFGSFKDEALKELANLKPILSKDEKRARNQRESFAKELLAEGLEIVKEDGDFLLLKDGKRLDDGHGHPVKWADYVRDRASEFFDFEANNGGSNSGNSNENDPKGGGQGAGGGKKYPDGIEKPKDIEAYTKLVTDKSIPLENRQAIAEAWSAENGRTE